ncbi:MAG: hypothetical protein PF487_02750, partial [Bacteroidales bacterium]|nr:hypothetical protein [Bacteroidales bacterium]
MNTKKLLLFSIIIFFFINSKAQNAFKYYKLGEEAFINSNYQEALTNFNNALEFENIKNSKEQLSILLYWKALSTYMIDPYNENIKTYLEKAINIYVNNKALILYAQLYHKNMKYINEKFKYYKKGANYKYI